MISISYYLLCPPLKNWGHIFCIFQSVTMSVYKSVYSTSGVRSISFGPYAWKLPTLVHCMPLEGRCSLWIFRSHEQRTRSKFWFFFTTNATLIFFIPLIFFAVLSNLVQSLPLENNFFLLLRSYGWKSKTTSWCFKKCPLDI